jgi:hypothetical protein
VTKSATQTKMPLPSIRFAFGRVGCMFGVPKSIEKSAIVHLFLFELECNQLFFVFAHNNAAGMGTFQYFFL